MGGQEQLAVETGQACESSCGSGGTIPVMPGPDIDFERIRPHGRPASRPSAFEELSSILLRHGVIEWPPGTRFQRFGNPDGGREGRGVLPNGDVWAWQSKYLFTFDASAAAQVSSSVKRVLHSEPGAFIGGSHGACVA